MKNTRNTNKKPLEADTPPRPVDIDRIPETSHPTKVTKFLNYISIASLIIVAIAIGIILHWSFASTEVLRVNNNPFPARVVDDPTGKTGGIVFLKIDYCKNLAVDGDLRISYVSASREVFLPTTREQGPKGCHNGELPVVIPLNLLKDQYKIKFHAVYNVNPLKRGVVEDFESQPVNIGTVEPAS